MLTRTRVASCAAIVLLFGGCDEFYGVNCTLIGGESGLTVRFSHVTSPITRVEVRTSSVGVQPAYVADCERIPAGCDNGVFFPEYSAPNASITVFVGSVSHTGSILLEYRTTFPNGRDCEPRLVNAAVIVDVRNGLVSNDNPLSAGPP